MGLKWRRKCYEEKSVQVGGKKASTMLNKRKMQSYGGRKSVEVTPVLPLYHLASHRRCTEPVHHPKLKLILVLQLVLRSKLVLDSQEIVSS